VAQKKTIICLIFYNFNFKNLEPIFIIFGTLFSKSMHHFSPHLIFKYRTLQFILIVKNDAFSRNCRGNKHAL